MNYTALIQSFKTKRVLVMGDLMIDSYLNGSVNRISPEAPVPVFNSKSEDFRLGGAANVALNLKKLGATVILCGIIGDDKLGKKLINLLDKEHINSNAIFIDQNRPTTEKKRIISGSHQLLRIDNENTNDVSKEIENQVFEFLELEIKSFDLIIFEDYNKGFLTENIILKAVGLAKLNNVFTAVDPKFKNFFAYKHVNLFKPNKKEIIDALGIKQIDTLDEFKHISKVLLKQLESDMILLTLSENGVLITNNQSTLHFNAYVRQIADVSGAGDTVIAVASLLLASGADMDTIANISNIAGGYVCEKFGVVSISADELIQQVSELLN